MNDDKKLYAIKDHLEKAMLLIEEVINPAPPQGMTVVFIEKYYSNSGNITWRCDTEYGERVYFRQQQKEMFEKAGIWEVLNSLDLETIYGCSIDILTVREGDFDTVKAVNPGWICPAEITSE